jgi:hypothetical protein
MALPTERASLGFTASGGQRVPEGALIPMEAHRREPPLVNGVSLACALSIANPQETTARTNAAMAAVSGSPDVFAEVLARDNEGGPFTHE